MDKAQKKSTPAVTVLMPAYNAEATIEESIKSVVDQTYTDWNLLIVDDESTDSTPEIYRRWAARDKRIKAVRVEHIGFTGVLNYGLNLSESRYIARIDSDDLWHAERLARQVSFLDEHPEVKVIGSWGDQIGTYGEKIQLLRHGPTSLQEYQQTKEAREPMILIHSSILADRRTVLDFGGYTPDDYPVDDTFLWTKIAADHAVLALPENLVSYRASQNGICSSNFKLLLMQFARLEHNLKNKCELSRREFETLLASDWRKRLNFSVNYWQKFARRDGVMRFRNRRKISGGFLIALGFMLDPSYCFKKVFGHLNLSEPPA